MSLINSSPYVLGPIT